MVIKLQCLERRDYSIPNNSLNNQIKLDVKILTHSFLCNRMDFFEKEILKKKRNNKQ